MPEPLDPEAMRQLRHDIRSPLMVISGYAGLLAGERPLTDEDRREYARRIERAAVELREMLDEL